MKRILVASDGSKGGDRAVALAAGLAAAIGGELTIITVMDRAISDDLERFRRIEKIALDELLETEAKALLERARSIAAKNGVAKAKTLAEEGDAATAILAAAKAGKSDVVVVGKRGRGRLKGLLLGSTSQKLVSLANCSVVVVP
ncbi:MAG: universal stress protein [Rhizomicrobium sp.]